jgi:plasmid stability protein
MSMQQLGSDVNRRCCPPIRISQPPATHDYVVHCIIMESRSITFSLPIDLIRKAKVYAAEHNTTINALVRELLSDALTRESRAQAAARRLLALADRGPYFTIDPGLISREELNERR